MVNIDHVGLPSGKQLQHVIFDVKMTDADQDLIIVPSVTVSQGLYDDDEQVADEWPSLISPKIFCNLFPYHILFDDQMRIKQCGVTIQKMSHYKVNPGNDIRYELTDYLISSLLSFSSFTQYSHVDPPTTTGLPSFSHIQCNTESFLPINLFIYIG